MTAFIFRMASLLVLAATFCSSLNAQSGLAPPTYDPGASATEIKIGNTVAYSGNASAYSQYARAIAAVFAQINESGGINGRKLKFISYDDAYSPPKTLEMVRRLVEQDEVLFIFNPLGTASNTAIQRYLNQKKVPQLFVASGASKWGNYKEFPWTMGWQPDYEIEGEAYARHALSTVSAPKIAILMQNDDYGRDFLRGIKAGLGKERENLIVQVATYEVTDPSIDSQILQLSDSGANVLFDITTPKFSAQAIKKAAEIGWHPQHYLNNISASFGQVFGPAGLSASQGIVTAQYRKDVNDPQWDNSADVTGFKEFMNKYLPNADMKDDYYNYGYAVAHTLIQVIKQCGDDLTRANVMRQASDLRGIEVPLLLPGIKVRTSAVDYYPIEQLYLARVTGQSLELISSLIDGTRVDHADQK